MSKPVLTLLGTASIQSYIFRSNKLKENVGASFLILDALEAGKDSTQGLVARLRKTKNTTDQPLIVDDEAWKLYLDDPKTTAQVAAQAKKKNTHVEILYTGGGNAALRFCDLETAKRAIQQWSRALLQEAPGLRVSAAHEEIAPSQGGLQGAYQRALGKLAIQEDGLPFGALYQAQPLFRTCVSTGMAAHEYEGEEALSAEAHSKRSVVKDKKGDGAARKRWEEDFAHLLGSENEDALGDLEFPYAIENLGTTEGESHIALVHADGNGIGKLLDEVIKDRKGRSDEEFLHDLRAFSSSVGRVAFDAFYRVLEKARKSLLTWCEEKILDLPEITRKNPERYFPVQPLVYGGDDLTFVCHGKIGLALAAEFLKEIEKQPIRVCGTDKTISACAGIAIIPPKFPFARAYEMSEELCASAKARRREIEEKLAPEKNTEVGGYLDFHIITGGSVGSIEDIREDRYRSTEDHALCYRPWPLRRSEEETLDWSDFLKMLSHFERWPRSRSKGLLLAMVRGEAESRQYLSQCQYQGYTLHKDISDLWESKKTPYFDVLEAMEYHVPLVEESKESTAAHASKGAE
jgi:hypothetical protein